jgi:uncharacterized protein YjiS (DUF1127 family)
MSSQIKRLSLPLSRSSRFSLLSWIGTALSVARQRHDLAQLDERMLSDIGLSADEAQKEANRAPWDVPSHWRF